MQFIAYLYNMVQDRKDEGATAVEYGLIVAGIAAVIVAVVFVLGTQVDGAFQTVSDEIAGP